jgi:hypothetical protein
MKKGNLTNIFKMQMSIGRNKCISVTILSRNTICKIEQQEKHEFCKQNQSFIINDHEI